jgi:hypothetical protein
MKKTILKAALAALVVALPVGVFAAQGIIGDCVDCHTMHNSEMGEPVALRGTDTTATGVPIQNLLRMDCLSCHANPSATLNTVTLPGGSVVPQVSFPNDGTLDDLAAGNFAYSTASQRKGHNVIDITAADNSNTGPAGAFWGSPPGIYGTYHGEASGVFTTEGSATAFDAFTCAGARGCHGTRGQLLTSVTVLNGLGTDENDQMGVRRTGIAAISGAHHNSHDGLKDSTGYSGEVSHDGQIVADGYRFIPGLIGYGNETDGDRWMNVDENSHNEYMGVAANMGSSCTPCHQQGHGEDSTGGGGTPDVGTGYNTRAAINSYIKVPNNSMSGFCSSCHHTFHSTGTENGASGAFLRHPSDFVIPEDGEYAAYDVYDVTAPVSRPLADFVTGMSAASDVAGDTDMVMCLSCHKAHASENDYMLRFDYSVQTAGDYADIAAATAEGGCMACHTTKGVLPENR